MQIVGYRQVSYTNEGNTYHGYRLYLVGEFSENEKVHSIGKKTDVINWVKPPVFEDFIRRCDELGKKIVDVPIEIFYDKYKKPSYISIVQ